MLYLFLVGLLLLDDAYGVDALVHADGILVVVGRPCKSILIVDAVFLVSVHILLQYRQLDGPYLYAGVVLRLLHILYSV